MSGFLRATGADLFDKAVAEGEAILERRDFEACSRTWALAAAVRSQAVAGARPRVVARDFAAHPEGLRVVGGMEAE